MSTVSSSRRNVALIGFMGSGKTTVGRIIADSNGMEFIDIDQAIEEAAGMSVAQIFSAQKEQGFRALESAAIKKAAAGRGRVIACGGGAATIEENVASLREVGPVVYLQASPDVVFERLKGEVATRPLIASGDPYRAISRLLRERENKYERAATHTVETDGLTPEAVAQKVMSAIEGPGNRDSVDQGDLVVEVPRGTSRYPLMIGSGRLSDVGGVCQAHTSGKCIVLTDKVINKLYGDLVATVLDDVGLTAEFIVINSGESMKNWDTVRDVHRKLIELGAERRDLLVALGGGVIGDLGGFAASTYQRGMPFVQVPATLLSQVDSSIGGKTGVNLDGLKNMVGSFYQPKAVIIDTDTLATLSRDELLCGVAEIVKAGLLTGDVFTDLIEAETQNILNLDVETLTRIIKKACRFKADVVQKDEKEAGHRRILNYGHTLAHALEATSPGGWKHGHAVAVGMVFAARLADRLGIAAQSLIDRHISILDGYGLPVTLPEQEVGAILRAIRSDKKRSEGQTPFVLLSEIGCPVVQNVDEELVSEELEAMMRGNG